MKRNGFSLVATPDGVEFVKSGTTEVVAKFNKTQKEECFKFILDNDIRLYGRPEWGQVFTETFEKRVVLMDGELMKELVDKLYCVLTAMCTEIHDGTVHGMPQGLVNKAEAVLVEAETVLK